MPSGLINIVSYGADDLYLTGAPQITFFKLVYRRYTNFSKESISIPLDRLDFDSSIEVILPQVGDAVGELYFQFQIPAVSILKSDLDIDIENTLDTTAQDNYNTIINFMKINAQAFRVAYNDSQAVGLPPTVVTNDIIDVFSQFTSSLNTIALYRSILTIANQTLQYDWLDPSRSDISDIINNIAADLAINSTSWTNSQILSRIQLAIQTSLKVQGFFYNQLLAYKNTYQDQISQNASFAWVKRLGHSIIDYIDVNIGGEKIDRHYGDWINIWYELSGNYYQKDIYATMIGDVPKMTTFDKTQKPTYLVTVPLSFWFCRHSGMAIPLIALQYNQVSLTIKLKKIEDCAYVQKNPNIIDPFNTISLTDLWENKGYSLTGSLLVDYIYLDTIERNSLNQHMNI